MPTSKRRETGEGDRTFELSTTSGDTSARPVVSLLWEGGAATLTLPERDPCLIGRKADADIMIDSRSISRQHARLHQAGGFAIEDLGSANGTRVRGQVLSAGERVSFELNEPVMIGSAILVLRPGAASAPSETTATAGAPGGKRRSAEDTRPGGPRPRTSPMDEVERLISLVAPSEMSVLLLGETGAGKGFFARQIHDRSRRASGPFLHLNCAALPENLLESELFGYERGAFSGAAQAKPGLLESAERGTVFLDEVGDLPASVQAKLLVAIERREVLRLGALKAKPIDVRFISATNRATDAQGIAGLRPDLYFRLAGLPINLPPLRERVAEIPALASAFLREASKRIGREPPTLSPAASQALAAHPWPGNVRELAAVIDRALLFCGDTLLEEDLHLGPPRPAPEPPSSREGRLRTEAPRERRPLAAEVEEIERQRIIEALEACGGNQSRAAEMLGISRRTLITRMIEFGLPRPRKG
ncbi:MAG: sigma 54-interacting transcriptional regulator [Polyangiaceae bacterium]|nr:sigma 54-interacting transcriptional regulator [Polyangiaceae bacterium]